MGAGEEEGGRGGLIVCLCIFLAIGDFSDGGLIAGHGGNELWGGGWGGGRGSGCEGEEGVYIACRASNGGFGIVPEPSSGIM